ncbi:AAA family ATPase [Candidatus Parcubacteria bacterium]|nr:MAG: AAA family ATPase [Candidatus Parcubacteria bacterium]
MGLYQTHRPRDLADVKGQKEAVGIIRGHLERGVFPPATLYYGPSGTGKTTLARYVCKELGCKPPNLQLVNAADDRGIDTVRSIRDKMGSAPLMGKYRIWIFDECHQWTSQAQSVLLEMLEDAPDHVKFMLCTTDPQKLLPTIRGRCAEIKTKELDEDDLYQALLSVCLKEEKLDLSKRVVKKTPEEKVLRLIAEKAEGSARAAIQRLDDISGLKTTEEQLRAIMLKDVKSWSKSIAQLLIDPEKTVWADVAEQLKGKTNDEAESIRQQIMGWANSVLLDQGIPKWAIKQGKKFAPNQKRMERAHRILEIFECLGPYDGGLHRLTRFCYEACNS